LKLITHLTIPIGFTLVWIFSVPRGLTASGFARAEINGGYFVDESRVVNGVFTMRQARQGRCMHLI
jgi:hypothetical protein